MDCTNHNRHRMSARQELKSRKVKKRLPKKWLLCTLNKKLIIIKKHPITNNSSKVTLTGQRKLMTTMCGESELMKDSNTLHSIKQLTNKQI